ncbi:MAG: hypothetical protein COZ32_11360 [Nitrospirae bacterium CG_4_10_14_3_um_filter_53_41]|nr:MAG: hypothetical protein COZ32_11360 [Nitrospirae bacterium CG_4_10_14_3_um_filter_53_41]
MMPEPCIAEYVVVWVKQGVAVEVNHFGSLEEATRVFEEIASDCGYEPGGINKSGKHDVSIWEWTEDRYEKIYGY